MVVNRLLGLTLSFCLLACTSDKPGLFSDTSSDSAAVISHKDYNVIPIALLSNMPVMKTEQRKFTLTEDSNIRIYAIGEAGLNRITVPPQYLYKGDRIEFFFRNPSSKRSLHTQLVDLLKTDQKIGDTLLIEDQEKRIYVRYDGGDRKYLILAIFPWKSLSVEPKVNYELPFNIAIGDNDDKVKQRAKIAWYGSKDPLHDEMKALGKIKLVSTFNSVHEEGVFKSIFLRGSLESTLSKIESVSIANLVFGQVNEPDDLSASMKSVWDEQKLYIFTEVYDNVPRCIDISSLKEASSFSDYGWIENENGDVVWRMQNYYSRHAGGALKNQIIDTVIKLKSGKYTLKYTTDESHSWDDWDDKPPQIPFYGIALFKAIKAEASCRDGAEL